MDRFRYLLALARTAQKASVALRAAFLLQAIFMVFNNLLYFGLWWVLMKRFPSVGGYTFADITLLFGVCCMGFGVAVVTCGGMFQLGRHIGDGDLDALLCQPRNVLWRALGSHSNASGYGDIASGLLLITGSELGSAARIPLVLLAVLLSAATLVSTAVVVQSLVFWLGRVERVSRSLFEVVLSLANQPPTLFQGGIKLLLFSLLPAAFVAHVPAAMIRSASAADLALATSGTLMVSGVAVFVWSRGLRRYASGSRFGVWA